MTNPADEDMRRTCERVLTIHPVNSDAAAVARYVLDRLGEQTRLDRAREAFLNICADGELSEQIDGDENGATVYYKLKWSHDREIKELLSAFGYEARYTTFGHETVKEIIDRAISEPAPEKAGDE